jgi:hypothetical protein
MDDSEKGMCPVSPLPHFECCQVRVHRANGAGIATLAGYSSTHRPVTVNRGTGSSGMLRSPRIGDIGIIPPLEKVDGGEGPDTRKPGGGTDGTGYFAQSMDGGGMAGADGGVDSAGQVMEREIWQETDTMYDNLPFDPAYRTSLPILFCKISDTFPAAFGSEAANLEYAMLSSMFADSGTVTTPTLHSNSNDPPLFTLDNDWPESAPLGREVRRTEQEQGQGQEMQISQPFGGGGVDGEAREGPGEGEIAGLTFTGSAGGMVVESPVTTMTPRDVYSLVVKPQ